MLNDDLIQTFSDNINNLFGKSKVQKVVIRQGFNKRLDNIFCMSILQCYIFNTERKSNRF